MYLLNANPEPTMSRLSDQIRKAGRAEPAPLGFAAAVATKARPTMLVAARVNDAGKAADAASKGADIVIIEGASAGKLKGLDKTAEAAIGASGDFDREASAQLRDFGVDFVVLDGVSAAAGGLLDEKTGHVLAINGDLDDISLRLLGDLGLDALIVPAPELPLTVERLLTVRRLSALTRTPLLAEVPADIDAASLELLRDSGVAGVVLSDAGKAGGLKERIAALPPRGRRREDHAEALISSQAAAGHDHGDDEDDDWDD
jgi:hypothetical protein